MNRWTLLKSSAAKTKLSHATGERSACVFRHELWSHNRRRPQSGAEFAVAKPTIHAQSSWRRDGYAGTRTRPFALHTIGLAVQQWHVSLIRVARGRVCGGGSIADWSSDNISALGRSWRLASQPSLGGPTEFPHHVRTIFKETLTPWISGHPSPSPRGPSHRRAGPSLRGPPVCTG